MNTKRVFFLILALFIIIAFSGCAAKHVPLPFSVLDQDNTMCVNIKKISDDPNLGGGGFGTGGCIGAIVKSSRQSKLKKKMPGIKGETVKELLEGKISDYLEDSFEVIEFDENPKLVTDVTINQWGWFLPAGVAGISTGIYHSQINGIITVRDANGKQIAYLVKNSQIPIGEKPTTQVMEDGLLKNVDVFAGEVVAFLLGKTTDNTP